LVAVGNERNVKSGDILRTHINAPRFYFYGQIRFGNGKNIGLAFAKMKITEYDNFDEEQKENFDKLLDYYKDETKKRYFVNMEDEADMESKKTKEVLNYCGEDYKLEDSFILYKGHKV